MAKLSRLFLLPAVNHQLEDLAKKAGSSYADEMGKQAADATMDYEKANGQDQLNSAQQQLEDAKAQAQVGSNSANSCTYTLITRVLLP